VVIPVLNKVDLSHAEIEQTKYEIELMFDLPDSSCIPISAKTGKNINSVLDAIVKEIPPPSVRPYPGFWCFDASVGEHGSNIHFIKNFGNQTIRKNDKVKGKVVNSSCEF